MKYWLITICCLWMMIAGSTVHADYLGCYVPGSTIQLPASFFSGNTSSSATSKKMYIIDPGGNIYRTSGDGEFLQVNAGNQPGEYRVPFPNPQTQGMWRVTFEGIIGGSTTVDSGPDVWWIVAPGGRC